MICGAGLTVIKLAVGLLSQSVSVISEAAHSASDLVAALIAFWAVRTADRPPDKRHQYGHGKVENASAIAEGALILAAAVWIVWEAVKKMTLILHHSPEGEVALPLVGGGVMAVSALANGIVAALLFRVAKRQDSPALKADAYHHLTDVYTSVGVGGALLAVHFTDWHLLDPVIAMAVVLMIVYAAIGLIWESSKILMDEALPLSDLEIVERVLHEHAREMIGFHKLRCRKAGAQRHIDFHLLMPAQMSIAHGHDFTEHLQGEIAKALPGSEVLIHLEDARAPGS